jgi:hypothetical protein
MWTIESGQNGKERKANVELHLRTYHHHQDVVRPLVLSYVTVISKLACYFVFIFHHVFSFIITAYYEYTVMYRVFKLK